MGKIKQHSGKLNEASAGIVGYTKISLGFMEAAGKAAREED